VQTFIEKYCVYFLGEASQAQELKKEQEMIHKEFTALIDSLM